MTSAAGICLYMIASRLAEAIARENEEEEDD